MSNHSPFGYGWVPPHWEPSTKTVKPLSEDTPKGTDALKTAYLEMQVAVTNKDAMGLKRLVDAHGANLPPARWKTLGRLAIKNFSPATAELIKANWKELFSLQQFMECVFNDWEDAFDFGLNTLEGASKKVSSNYDDLYYAFVAEPLINKKYNLLDKYRPKVLPAVSHAGRQAAAVLLIKLLTRVNEKNVSTQYNLWNELANENWETVFAAVNPYQDWRKPDHAFGLTRLCQTHPAISQQLEKAQKKHTLLRKRFEGIVLNTVFLNKPHEKITATAPRKIFTPEFAQMVEEEDWHVNCGGDTPLAVLRNHSFFSAFLQKYCTIKGIPYIEKRNNGVQNLLKCPDFVVDLIQTPEGVRCLRAAMEEPENIKTIAIHLLETLYPKKVFDGIVAAVTDVVDDSGKNIAHYLAQLIVQRGSWSVSSLERVFKSEHIDWDGADNTGVVAKTFVLDAIVHHLREPCEISLREREKTLMRSAIQKGRQETTQRVKTQSKRKI